MVYKPREDSFLLARWVRVYASGKVLDMGCGSGVISKEAMKKTDEVVGADIDPEAVKVCQEQGINAVISDLFSNVKGRFDLIAFNPPYLPEIENESEEIAREISGGKKGYEIIERFLKDAKDFLTENGKILLVCSSLTGDVASLAKKQGYRIRLLEEESYFFEKLRIYLLY